MEMPTDDPNTIRRLRLLRLCVYCAHMYAISAIAFANGRRWLLTILRLSSELVHLFKQTWGTDPTFACRAPGRVNIIGEHIDYHGYSVLPMATEADVSCGNSTVVHIRDCSRGCGIFPRLVLVGLMAGFCQSVGLVLFERVDVCWCGQKNGRTRAFS